MDMLKRSLAPITQDAWEEIDNRSKQVFKSLLSARKVVKVNGPKGMDYTFVPEGRLENVQDKEGEVSSGTYKGKPLVENRIQFSLNIWELDNVKRGAKDIDFANLEEAVKKIALYEENAIYNGLEYAQIQGLTSAAEKQPLSFGNDSASIMEGISTGIISLQGAYANKPYTLVVGKEAYKIINKQVNGYPLTKRIENLLGTNILLSHVLDGAIMIPYDSDDLELTIGQDFSIGYETHDKKTVRLFITESFMFRILDPSIIVKYSL